MLIKELFWQIFLHVEISLGWLWGFSLAFGSRLCCFFLSLCFYWNWTSTYVCSQSSGVKVGGWLDAHFKPVASAWTRLFFEVFCLTAKPTSQSSPTGCNSEKPFSYRGVRKAFRQFRAHSITIRPLVAVAFECLTEPLGRALPSKLTPCSFSSCLCRVSPQRMARSHRRS